MFETKKVPDNVLSNFEYNCQYTPDAVMLESKPRVPLFIYNEFKTVFDLALPMIEPEWFVMAGFTRDRIYRIWQNKQYQTPIALEEPNPGIKSGFLPGHIKGELYYVPGSAFKDIDKYMKNELEFRRVLIRIVLPTITVMQSYPDTGEYREWSATIGSAFMYVGIKEYWDPIISNEYFRLLEPIRDRRFKTYYSFEPKDIEWSTEQPASSPTESPAPTAEAVAKIAREIISPSTTTDISTVLSASIMKTIKEILKI